MAKHSRALHFKTGNTTDDVTLYTTLGEVVDPAVINADQTTGGAALYTVGTDVSYPALRVRDGNDTVFGALVSPSDKRATNLRVRYNNTTYAVGKTSTLGAYGICYFQQEANGPWTWARVDEDGNPLTENPNFDYIAPWSGIETVVIDGQTMVKIPKFYVKADTIASGTYAGAKARWVSPEKKDGYHIHPAFVRDGYVMDCIYIGAYEASLDANNIASSVANVTPVQGRGWTTPTNFRLQFLYDVAAINYLLLIELGTPDAQTAIGRGNVDTNIIKSTGSTNAIYRGIHEWWGNAEETIITARAVAGYHSNGRYALPSNQGDGVNISYNYNTSRYFGGLDDHHELNLDINDLFMPNPEASIIDNSLIPDAIDLFPYSDQVGGPRFRMVRGGAASDGNDAGPFRLNSKFCGFFNDDPYSYSSDAALASTRIAKDGTVTSEAAPNR